MAKERLTEKQIALRLPRSLYDLIVDEAERRDTTMARVIRAALREHFVRHPVPLSPSERSLSEGGTE